MGQIVVREIDDSVLAALERKARAHGRSLEAEARDVLVCSTKIDRAEARRLSAEFRARYGPFPGPDSVDMIREDRDR
ncbi:MAG: FitA-like ribbon-helix-helix domain-containing protein [Dehalococcoidia bacterium]